MNESTLVPHKDESDLDWLARNVHKWPDGVNFICLSHNDWQPVFSEHPRYCAKWFTKASWLARRAELQNKPSFSDHHDAKCFVQNDSGTWFKNRNSTNVIPERNGGWFDRDMSCGWTQLGAGEVLGDWRDTLEKRPEQAESKPFVSVEYANPKCGASIDVAFNNIKPDADLKSSRETCNRLREEMEREDAATAKQQSPKGSGNTILGMVLADLTNRALEGKEKYGEPLLAHNGRNPLWDAYQEALDLAMYLRQAIEEQK